MKITIKLFKLIFLAIILIMLQTTDLMAQGSVKRSTENASPQLKAYIDSLKHTPYENMLPFLGRKVQALGFEIPAPIGLMVNFTASQQNLTIADLGVAFNEDGNYQYVSGFAEFGHVTPQVINYNFRPDIWIFPFLNVSALVGGFSSATLVELTAPFRMDFTANNDGTIVGFGLLVAGGAGPLFGTLSYNQIWSYTKMMLEPGKSYNAGVRIGHNRKNQRKPQQAWSVWAVADWLQLNKRTIGMVNLNTLTDISQDDKLRASDELNEWYDGLPPVKQIAFKKIKDPIDDWLKNDKDTELYYDFNKGMVSNFSYGVGFQYKLSYHWQAQVEVTSDIHFERWRGTIGAVYRFGFRAYKNKVSN